MSGSFTNSASNTHTEARARYVFDKIKEDMMAIHNRGFAYPSWDKLKAWWEVLLFVAQQKALEKVQISFIWEGGVAAVDYVIESSGNIHRDNDSATINFYKLPKEAKVSVTIQRDPNNQKVTEYLAARGWGKGSFLTGNSQSGGAYSQGGYGVNISTIGL